MKSKKLKTLTEQEKREFLESLRFGGSAKTCPYCASLRVSGGICCGKDYHCNACNRNFTLYTKTPLHGKRISPLDLLEFVKLFANSTNGMSCRATAKRGEDGFPVIPLRFASGTIAGEFRGQDVRSIEFGRMSKIRYAYDTAHALRVFR